MPVPGAQRSFKSEPCLQETACGRGMRVPRDRDRDGYLFYMTDEYSGATERLECVHVLCMECDKEWRARVLPHEMDDGDAALKFARNALMHRADCGTMLAHVCDEAVK